MRYWWEEVRERVRRESEWGREIYWEWGSVLELFLICGSQQNFISPHLIYPSLCVCIVFHCVYVLYFTACMYCISLCVCIVFHWVYVLYFTVYVLYYTVCVLYFTVYVLYYTVYVLYYTVCVLYFTECMYCISLCVYCISLRVCIVLHCVCIVLHCVCIVFHCVCIVLHCVYVLYYTVCMYCISLRVCIVFHCVYVLYFTACMYCISLRMTSKHYLWLCSTDREWCSDCLCAANILKTLRGNGNVLIAVDTAGRVLELSQLLVSSNTRTHTHTHTHTCMHTCSHSLYYVHKMNELWQNAESALCCRISCGGMLSQHCVVVGSAVAECWVSTVL